MSSPSDSTLKPSLLWMALWGALLGLSAPGYSLWGLAWIALIPAMLWAQQTTSFKRKLLGGFYFGACFQAIYCLWFFDLHPLTWLGFDEISSRLVTLAGWLLIAAEGGLLTALFFSIGALPQKLWQRLCIQPLLWIALFQLLNVTPMALPWGLLEYTQASLWPIRWLAGLIGGIGIAFLLIFYATGWTAWFLWHCSKTTQPVRFTQVPFWWGVLVAPLLLGILQCFPPSSNAKQPYPLPVAIVQANLPIELIRSGQLNREIIEQAYLQPARKNPIPPGTLVLFPEEGVVPGWTPLANPLRNPFFNALQKLSNDKQIYIAVGVSGLAPEGQMYNTIALISPHCPSQFYHKRRLVPFGEYTPYGYGNALTELLARFQVDYSAPYTSGAHGNPLLVNQTLVGGLLCFELIDGPYAAQYAQQGADLLINLSNLGWFHQNPLIEAQFLAIGQMRAAETRTPLVIASNTGISAILSDTGGILNRTFPSPPSKWRKNQPPPQKSQIIFYHQIR